MELELGSVACPLDVVKPRLLGIVDPGEKGSDAHGFQFSLFF
jgi:hypothetical protein